MNELHGERKDNILTLVLSGRIDSNNSAQFQAEVSELLKGFSGAVVCDAADLEYISSAGLRVLLHIRKNCPDMKIINAGTEVYEILDMTGFTQMITVEKAYRVVSIEGAEEIGRGANGTIYRIDQDNVVKVYNNADALEDIRHEREVARVALVLGIPTAISYDVVKVGESYGSVFELLNARSFAKILKSEPEKLDWCVKEYTDLLEKIHGTLVPKGQLPEIKDTAVGWAEFLKDYLPKEPWEKLVSMMNAVPRDDHMIHGDYHTKNVELVGDEVLLIDMDTLAVGHPIFELGSIYNAFIGFSEYDHENIKSFQGFDFETAKTFWDKFLRAYLKTDDEAVLKEIEDKARIVGYTRVIRRSIRRGGLEDEEKRKEIELWKSELLELLGRTDSLVFYRNGLYIEAEAENLNKVLGFFEDRLEKAGCPMKTQMQIMVAVEEIFINVASYAYAPGKGNVLITLDIQDEPRQAVITFADSGIAYDPLKRDDPDISLPAEEREIGGLGIFMVKKTMDDMSYEYKDGQNLLTLKKFF